MIVFSCPTCGKELKVKADLSRKRGKCPHCKTKLLVPHASGDTNTPTPMGDSGSGSDSKPGEKISTKSDPGPLSLIDFLEPARRPDELGRLGKYRVLSVLGAGGMGIVYAGEDTSLKRPVALKALRPELNANITARERFLREAQATAGLEHDNIIRIYEVGETNGVPFMAMQLLKGETLDARLARAGRLAVDEVIRIGRETAEGLDAAHERGLVHRDIKPANLFLEKPKGRVKILDFGLAHVERGESKLTRLGIVVGSVGYLSPEQAAGRPVDARSDLFSLGCLLYHLTTGELPFKGDDLLSKLKALANTEPMPPNFLDAGVPEVFSDLILMLLDKDPDFRPPSARDLSEALASLGKKSSH